MTPKNKIIQKPILIVQDFKKETHNILSFNILWIAYMKSI